MNAAKPAFTWADVTQQPEFQNASQPEREQLQLRYFQQVVAPSLPEDQYRDMRTAFFEATLPDVEVKQPGLMRRGWDAVTGQGEHARPEYDGEPAAAVTGVLGTAPGEMTRQALPEPSDAPRWDDVAQSEAFQQADTRGRHDLRQQFFRDNVAGDLEGEERRQAERDFYRRTNVTGTPRPEGQGTEQDERSVGGWAGALPRAAASGLVGSYGAALEGIGQMGEQAGVVEANRRVDDARKRLETTERNMQEALAGTDERHRDQVAANFERDLAKRHEELHQAVVDWAEREPSQTAQWLRERGVDLRDVAEAMDADPAYAGVTTDVARGLGSMVSYMGPGMLVTRLSGGSMAAGMAASVAMAGPSGVSEQYGRAIQAGLSEEEALQRSMAGFGAGAIQVAPLAALVKPLPAEIQGKAIGQLYGLMRAFGAEAAVEGTGAVMQNLIEQSYNPERGTWDDSLYQAAISGSSAALLQAGIQAATRGRGGIGPGGDNTGQRGEPVQRRPEGDERAAFVEEQLQQAESEPAAQQPAQDSAEWQQAWRGHEQRHEQRHDLDPIDLAQPTGIEATVQPTQAQQTAAEADQVADLLRADSQTLTPDLIRARENLIAGDGYAFLLERAAGNPEAVQTIERMQQAYVEAEQSEDGATAAQKREEAAQAYGEATAILSASQRRGAQQERKQAAIEGARQQVAAEGGDALAQTLAGEQAEAQANELSARENAADPIIRPAPQRSPMAGRDMAIGPGSADAAPVVQAETTIPADAAISPLTPRRMPVEQIEVDPEAYQFRTQVNESGVDSRLEGVEAWDDLRAGNLLLHERADGRVFAADGHHRIDLARRLQQPDVNSILLREADGYSVEDARRLAAEANIAAGNATAIDAAKVFRGSEGSTEDVITERNLPRRSQVVRDGADLARLSGEAFGAVLNNVVSEKDGAAIGRAFTEPAEQMAAVEVFQRVQPQNDNQRALLVNEVRQAGFADAQGDQIGMFGDDPMQSLIGERVRVMDRLRQTLSGDRRLFATLNRNAPAAEQAGNVIATEQNEALQDASARAIALLERATTSPEINQHINDAARRVSEGQSVAEAARELKEVLLRGPDARAAQSDRSSASGRRQAAQVRQEQPGDQRVPGALDARAEDASQQRLDDGAAETAQRLTYRSNGEPFATEGSAMASGIARRAQGRGQQAEAVPVEGGFAVRVNEPGAGQALRGEAIDSEWTAFSESSGTRGIPRAEMPQIKAEHRGALANFLGARGIVSTEETVPANSLRPTQREFSEQRVQAAKDREGSDRAILVSADGHVIDGHHQWLARADQGEDVRVIRLDAPIEQVLEAAHEFPSSETEGDSLALETQTEDSLAARQRETQQAEQAETAERRQESERAQADRDADDFVLAGSDTDADQAMARGQDSLFSTRAQPAEGAPQASEIEALLANAPELADTRVIQSHRELPPEALMGMALRGVSPTDVRGMFVAGDLYVIANNLESAAEGVRVAVHEAVGHKGVRGVLGEDLVPVMRQVYRTLPMDSRGREALSDVLRDYPFLDRDNADHQVTIAEEMVAHLTEKGWNPGPVRRAIAKIRELLRRYFPNMRWTDADVMALAERSREYLRRQQAEADGDSDALLFSFAGERAETADLHSLQRAQESLDQGLDAEVVRQATGWFRGADGRWRFEIDDSGARQSDPNLLNVMGWGNGQDFQTGDSAILRLDKVLDHPRLFAAYPGLENHIVSLRPGEAAGGSFSDDGTPTIRMQAVLDGGRAYFTDEQFSTLLHEIQHGIQNIEGFARGGSPEMFRAEHQRLTNRVREINEQMREASRNDETDRYAELMEERGDIVPRIQELEGRDGIVGADQYERLAGEVEARNVQSRQGMTEAERAETSPAETQDVPDSDVVVIFNGEEMASAPPPANADDVRFSLSTRTGAPTANQVRESLQGIEGLGRPAVLDSADQLDLDTGLRLTLRGIDPQTAIAFTDDQGRLQVIAGNAESEAAAVEAAVLERVSRQGLRSVLGDRLDTIAKRAYENIPGHAGARNALRAVRAEYDYLNPAIEGDRTALTLEVSRRLSEAGNAPTFAVEAMEQVTGLLSDRYSIADADTLARASRDHLNRMQRDYGGKAPPAPSAFALLAQDGPGYGTLLDMQPQVIDADGNVISDVKIDAGMTLNPGNLMLRLIESQSDRLRRSNSPVLNEMARRIDRYFDREESRLGMVNGLLRPAMRAMQEGGRRQRKENELAFERYWRAWDNGRREQAKEIYDTSPAVAKMVDAAVEMFHRTGQENQTVKTPTRTGMWVFDGKQYRKIGKVRRGEFWPRALRRDVQAVIQDPHTDTELWHQLLDSLVDGGHAKDRQEAAEYLRGRNGYYSGEISQDYFAGIEKARGEKLPEVFYDYSLGVVADYGRKWAHRISQVENFGQKLRPTDRDAFEEAINVAADRRTKDYLGEVGANIYGRESTSFYSRFMGNANVLATGMQLGGWGTATLNLMGGSQLNVQMFGSKRVLNSYLELASDFQNLYQEGVELGILGKDLMNLMRDAEQDAMGSLSRESMTGHFGRLAEKVSGNRMTGAEAIREFTRLAMKYGGYNGTEQIIRANAMISAKGQLMDALQAWNQGPQSSKARKYRAFMRRNRIDVGKLIRENGKGEETARYLRLMVNLPQGSYRADQAPLYTDTPMGRFFFKYQKFGTQVSRLFWNQRIKPFVETVQDPQATARDRAEAFRDIVTWAGWSMVGGNSVRAARWALFGYLYAGADWDEIIEAFQNDETALAMGWMAEMAFNNAIAGSMFGFFGNYMQIAKDINDQQRVKNPMEPPGFAAVDGVVDLGRRALQQGKLTGQDIIDVSTRQMQLFRVADRTAATLTNAADLQIDRHVLEQKRRDTNYIRGAVRRWADASGIEGRQSSFGGGGRTENTPSNNRIHDAVRLGNAEQARELIRADLEGLNRDERRQRLQSVRATLRARHPLRLGSNTMNQEQQAAFKRWAKESLPESKWEVIEEETRSYDQTMARALFRL